MPYHLDNAFLLDNPWITVVGCGGTGGFVAEGLCRLFQGREATIVLVDHDRVEPHNLLRQNFYGDDVGKFKSQALADRLAKAYRRPVGYSVYPFREYEDQPHGHGYPGLPNYGGNLIIGCADNAAARRAMAGVPAGRPATVAHRRGQRHQLGPGPRRQRGRADGPGGIPFHRGYVPTGPRAHAPAPDLLTAVSTRPPDVDCAAALDLTDQDPTINQMMASLALQVVRRMVAGTCPFMALYLDMDQGTVTPTYVTPEAVERLVGPTPSDRRTQTYSENEQGETMSDDKRTTTTPHQVRGRLWQDAHSGLRRHKLMTKELGDTIPAIRANEKVEDIDDVVAHAKLFSPYADWTWYVTEWDAETGLCFGLVEGLESEIGYFELTELAEATVLGGVPAIERDLLLGAEDHRRDQERGAAGGLAVALQETRKGEDHDRRDRDGNNQPGRSERGRESLRRYAGRRCRRGHRAGGNGRRRRADAAGPGGCR